MTKIYSIFIIFSFLYFSNAKKANTGIDKGYSIQFNKNSTYNNLPYRYFSDTALVFDEFQSSENLTNFIIPNEFTELLSGIVIKRKFIPKY
ncbi:hypothetical protein ACM39_08715 [Chryseobacterium sp. FH2]|uniref:hypothetical protein n=1 Tax=Chryseobacterium sp. FH2 TaxID=1674291 RepID=UPI00065AB92B|nr:hypothetical protein [Chryseobacterium sp. FH2]KMQ68572.1 hypothetical protein ACM39_08715 [Chryseobacterium sp. FH2]